mgnify:CR=1 FL=1|tara:strand:+ start:37 stop:417 length:381 start_codon:yes stop_codon:yes gene_type:complete
MATPFKMKGSPFARNFGAGGSPLQKNPKKILQAGKKVYDYGKKLIKSFKKQPVEKTYFNTKTGTYSSKPSGNVHKTGDTYSKTYPHYKTKPTNNYSGPRKTKNTILPSEKRVPWDPTKRQILRHGK